MSKECTTCGGQGIIYVEGYMEYAKKYGFSMDTVEKFYKDFPEIDNIMIDCKDC